jgi:hypothetical protein
VRATKDGVKFADPKVNVVQLNSDVFDFWVFTNTLSTHFHTSWLTIKPSHFTSNKVSLGSGMYGSFNNNLKRFGVTLPSKHSRPMMMLTPGVWTTLTDHTVSNTQREWDAPYKDTHFTQLLTHKTQNVQASSHLSSGTR